MPLVSSINFTNRFKDVHLMRLEMEYIKNENFRTRDK